MTVTVVVFFHAVITVRNESVFFKAEKYPLTIFRNPNIRLLTGKIKKHVSYRKPRAVSTEQRERARRKMLKINSDGSYRTKSRKDVLIF